MLQIHLFGHLRMLLDGQPYRFHTLPKTPVLLAYLLLNRDTAVPRDHLAYLLWDDVSESEARANLRRHLHDLRRALPAHTSWVLSDAKSIQWQPTNPIWLDIAEFESLAQDTGRLAEAITLYTGDLLQELYDDWLITHRERLRTLYFTAVTRLINRERERGDLLQAMIYAQQLLQHDPLREDVVRDLIAMRHESGDRAGAMQLYQQFAGRLGDELGVTPMPQTSALYEAIARNVPLPMPLSSAAPPPAPPAHNLPARLTSFVGRQQEMAQVCALMGKPDAAARLLTITGPGGSGKTRLALEVAQWLWQNRPELFADGIFFVGLAAIANPDFVVTAVAETLNARPKPGQPELPGLIHHLQSKQMLLVLDNFEHLLPSATIVTDLLTAVPGLRVLVTSQTPLHLYGEQEFPLSPLPLPDREHLPPPETLLQFAAIGLFVERLKAVKPDFALTTENAPLVADICYYLDGIPLALELAAARGKLFTLADMLSQLAHRLHFLSSQARNLPARHQTLRATLDWSFHLLEPAEQHMFACLSLFAASFSQEGATAVCADVLAEAAAVSPLIYSLVDKNIIRSLPDSPTAETRFRLLQTLREYGLEKLEQSPASNEIRQRYALYYLAFTRQAEEGLRAGEQAFWLARLREEDANIMAALAWLAAHLDDPEKGRLAARLVSSLERFWSLQGRFGEAHTWYGRVLPLAHLLPADEQIKLLNKAGVIAQHMGDYATAAVYHTTALSLARQTSEPLALAQTLHYLGFAAGRQGEYDEARTLLEESLACYRLLPGDQTAAITTLLNNLSIVYRRQGQIKQAVAVLTEALALKRQLNDQIGLPAVLGNLGQLLAAQGDVAQATAYVREGLQIRRALQDQPGLLTSIEQMADLFWQGGRFLPALTLFAATAHQRQIMHLPLTAQVQMEREEILAKLRAATGDAAYTAVWATRERISLDTAVQLALDESK